MLAVAIAGLVLTDLSGILSALLRLLDGLQGELVLDPIAKVVDVLQPVPCLQTQVAHQRFSPLPTAPGFNVPQSHRPALAADGEVELAQVIVEIVPEGSAHRIVQIPQSL